MANPKRPGALGPAAFSSPPRAASGGGALAAMEGFDEAAIETSRRPTSRAPSGEPVEPARPVADRRLAAPDDRAPARITTHVSGAHLRMVRRAAHWGRQSQRAFLEDAIEEQAARVAAQEGLAWPLPPTPEESGERS
jgi:hypothetical protein